jgi:hypothetical protein
MSSFCLNRAKNKAVVDNFCFGLAETLEISVNTTSPIYLLHGKNVVCDDLYKEFPLNLVPLKTSPG